MGLELWALPSSDAPRLARYRLLYEIGRGGTGTVFLAVGPGLHGSSSWVAIKTLSSLAGHSTPAEVEHRLVEEARVLSALAHPNVVRLIELGSDASGPYLVMEYVHGEQLSALVERATKIPERVALFIGARVAAALDEAHRLMDPATGRALALVHRDIAPENILVSYDGVPKLLDFSVAWTRERLEHTATGIIKGRIRYMSPEQRSGLRLDARSDVYSLGFVLAEAVLGLRGQVIDGWEHGIVARLHELELPPVEAVLARALATDPNGRFAGAGEMARALEDAARAIGTPASEAEVAAFAATFVGDRRKEKERMLALAAAGAGASGSEGAAGIRSARTEEHALPLAGATAGPLPRAAEPRRADTEELLLPATGADHVRSASVPPPELAIAASREGTTDSSSVRALAVPPSRGPIVSGSRAVIALLLTAGIAGVAAAVMRSSIQTPEIPLADSVFDPSVLEPICLLGLRGSTSEEREATWLLVRRVAERLAAARSKRVLVHGYRALDAAGWDADGLATARRACAAAGAEHAAEVGVTLPGAGSSRIRAQVAIETARGVERATGEGRDLDAVAGVIAEELDPSVRGARAPAAALSPRAFEALLRAREHLWQDRYQEALPAAQAAIQADPNLEEAYLIRALVGWWTGRLDDPKARASDLAPPSHEIEKLERALNVLELIVDGRAAESCGAARALMALDPAGTDAYAAYVAGEAMLHGCDLAKGVELLTRALELRPELGPARYHVRRALLSRGDFEGAERLAASWERLDPGAPGAAVLRAQVLLGRARYGEAVEAFESVLARWSSKRIDAEVGIGAARALAGAPAAALARLERAVTLESADVAREVLLLGYALALAGGGEEAIATWRAKIVDRTRPDAAAPGGKAGVRQLALGAAVLEEIAGRRGSKAEWVAPLGGHRPARPYRFEGLEQLLDALEARAAKRPLAPLAARALDPSVAPVVRALALEESGDRTAAASVLEQALRSTADGDLDCLLRAELARMKRASNDEAGASAACNGVLEPTLPAPICLLLAASCRNGRQTP